MENLTTVQQKAFITALLYVATIDDHYHPAEQAFVEQALHASQLGEQDRSDVLEALRVRPDVEHVLSRITDKVVARQLIQQLILLAYADDDYSTAEQEGVHRIARFFSLSDAWVGSVEQWAADGMTWRRRGQELLDQP